MVSAAKCEFGRFLEIRTGVTSSPWRILDEFLEKSMIFSWVGECIFREMCFVEKENIKCVQPPSLCHNKNNLSKVVRKRAKLNSKPRVLECLPSG